MLKSSHILVAAAFFLVLVLGIAVEPACADSNCSNSCKAAYGSCYKSTQDRARCQSQLQRCLEACIRRTKR